MRTFSLVVAGSLMAAALNAYAHKVVWRGNPDGLDPGQPLELVYPGDSESILVTPISGEDCTVQVSVDPQTSGLINAEVVLTPALKVEIVVTALRAPAGSSETALISGKWYATGLRVDGTPDPTNCDAVMPTPFFVTVVVSEPLDGPEMTSENYTDTATDGDPVNLFTGEFTMEEEPDLDLGGPMPLKFCRYYASGLTRDSLVENALGPNWACNYDWRAFRNTNQVNILSWKGRRIQFQRVGGNWQLAGSHIIPYQLQDSGTDLILADPREEHLYTFNTNGLLTAISDGRGHIHTLSYQGGSLQQVSDGLGRILMLTNDNFHQLAVLTDGQRTVTFTYNASYLSRVTDVMTNATAYTYDLTNSIQGLLTPSPTPRAEC